MSIYKLREELEGLLSLSDEVGPEAIRDTITGMSGEIGDILENVAKYIRNLEGDRLALKSEIDRLSGLESSADRRIESARAAIAQIMELAGQDSFRTALFTLSLAKGSESVEVFDELALPDEFVNVETKVKPNKKAIKDAIKNNVEVPGARLVTGDKVLRIK